LRQGKSDRIAIIGEPGAGKTTLLQHIAFWVLEQGLGLPIWISLGDLIKSGDFKRLKDYLTQVWLEDAIPNVTEEVKSDFLCQLDHQRVWLLLDGADEIVASSGIALREIHNQLRSWLKQSSIVLTCRINVWDTDVNALRDFQTYRTKEFHYPTQVEQFIESGFRKSNQLSGERLKTELAKTEHGRLQQIVRNPLRLMMLCTTWHEQERLPTTKAELYGRFVDEFYKWNRAKWKKKDLNYSFFPNTKDKQEKLNQALGRLACRALDEEVAPFRLPHNLVFDELGDPENDGSDFWVALNLGWLQIARNSDNPSEKVYTFFHPTFQEYFAAFFIDNWHDFLNHIPEDPSNRYAKYRVFKSCWEEIILLWFGRLSIEKELKEAFIEALINFEDECGEFYWYQTYFLAALCFTEFTNSRYISDVVNQVIYWGCSLYTTFLDPINESARAVLARTNRPVLLNTLVNLLNADLDESDLLEIAMRLGEIDPGNLDSITCLIKLINTQEIDEHDRWIAIYQLGNIGEASNHAEAMYVLTALLNTVKDDEILWRAATSLLKINSYNSLAIKTLARLLKSDKDNAIRLAATRSLIQVIPNSSIDEETLINLASNSQDDEIYSSCVFFQKNSWKIILELLMNQKSY
jgi:HEAT repeat protein